MGDKWGNEYQTSAYRNSCTTPEACSRFNEYKNHQDRHNRKDPTHESFQRRPDRSRSPVATYNHDEYNSWPRDLEVNFQNQNGIATYDYEHKQQPLQRETYDRNTECHTFGEQNQYHNVHDNYEDTMATRIPDNFQQDQGEWFPGMLYDTYEPEDKRSFEDNYCFNYHHGQISMGNQTPSDGFNLPELNSKANRNASTHFQQPQATTAAQGKREIKANMNLNLYITDRNEPDGKILDKDRVSALRKALFNMLFKELLSDDFSVRPRFKSCRMFDGIFKVIAADEPSARFLKDRVEKMRPPWLGAKLFVDNKFRRQFTIEALVPGVRIGWKKVFAEIRKFDQNIRVEMWQRMGVREHSLGHVFTFTIDFESYNLLDKHGGSIPYGDSQIEFRVLRNDDIY